MLQLPLLKECAIRLGRMDSDRDRNSDGDEDNGGNKKAGNSLIQLAVRTTLQVTGKLTLQPFRFLDLPVEIQLKILEFADLVTPYDIEWNPAKDICPVGGK
jgi:hypothetical protein